MVRIQLRLDHARSAARGSRWRRCPRAGAGTHRPAGGSARRADAAMQISWEVRNRFRLFREERDFLLHADGAAGRSILASEQALELQSDGRGWARNMVNRLCIDLLAASASPAPATTVKESYLTPVDHPVTVRLTGQVPVGATCAWSFDDGEGPAAIHLRLRRAGQSPGALWPAHRRHRGGLEQPMRRSGSRPRSRCAISSSPASATASPPAKAIRTGRSRWPTRVFASAPISAPACRNITVRAAPDIRADGPAKRLTRCRCGSARARSGSIRPATARSTATRPAPRWRSPCNIRTSR